MRLHKTNKKDNSRRFVALFVLAGILATSPYDQLVLAGSELHVAQADSDPIPALPHDPEQERIVDDVREGNRMAPHRNEICEPFDCVLELEPADAEMKLRGRIFRRYMAENCNAICTVAL